MPLENPTPESAAGGARQDTGAVGKIPHWQGTVNGHDAARPRAWPVATRVYLPAGGVEEEGRRKRAPIPQDVPVQPKAAIALVLLAEATPCGVKPACVTGEAEEGEKPNVLPGLAEREERPVMAVRATCSVGLGRGHDRPGRRAAAVRAAHPRRAWHSSAWSEGAQGWWRAQFLARRCGRVEGEGSRHGGWLLGQRPGRGPQGDGKYCWRDFPPTTPLAVLVAYAHRRHWVEPSQEEAKTARGGDH